MTESRNNEEIKRIKELCLTEAAKDFETLLNIIGDLGHVGYRISMCKLKGNSYQQCANRFGVTKSAAQRAFEKCIAKRYDEDLKRLFKLK